MADDGAFGNLFGSFGSILDAKKTFMKTLFTTVTSPLRTMQNFGFPQSASGYMGAENGSQGPTTGQESLNQVL